MLCVLLHVHCCCWCSILMLVSNGAWGGGEVGSHFIAGTPVCRIGTDRSWPSTWYICNSLEKCQTIFHHKPIFSTFIHSENRSKYVPSALTVSQSQDISPLSSRACFKITLCWFVKINNKNVLQKKVPLDERWVL